MSSAVARRLTALVLAGALLVLSPAAPALASPPSPRAPADNSATAEDLFASQLRELLALQQKRGTAAALRVLDRRIHAIPALAGLCHPIAHELGHAALALVHGNIPRALGDRNDVCGGGFTHGVIEAALGESRHLARDLLRVCAPGNDGSCFHGIGHGVMFATGMDVGRSLTLCDRAPSTTLSVRCGEGVFMQLFSADASAHHTAADPHADLSAASAQQQCSSTRAPYSGTCWFYAPTVWLADHPDDFSGALSWCARQGDGAATCTKGVGSRAIKYHPDDVDIAASACSRAGKLQDSCLSGMGSYWSVHHKGRRAPSDVCRHISDANTRARCDAVLT